MGHVINMTVIQDAIVQWRANATRVLALKYEETKTLLNDYNARRKAQGSEEPTTVVREGEPAIVATVDKWGAGFLSAVLTQLGYKTDKETCPGSEQVAFTGRWANGQRWNFFLSMGQKTGSPLQVDIEAVEWQSGRQTTSVVIEQPLIRLILKIDKITLEVESSVGRFVVELGTLAV